MPLSKEGNFPGSTNSGRKYRALFVGICVWSSFGVHSSNLTTAEGGLRMDLRKRTSRQGKTNEQTNTTKETSSYQRGEGKREGQIRGMGLRDTDYYV